MSSWQSPTRRSHRRAIPDDLPPWKDRLLAALLAPVLFNVCLFLALVSVRSWNRGFIRLHFVPSGLLVALAVVPMIVGLALGLEGLVRLMGHTFLTHPGTERRIAFTVAMWAGYLMFASSLTWWWR